VPPIGGAGIAAREPTISHRHPMLARWSAVLLPLACSDRGIRVGNETFGVDPHVNDVMAPCLHARGRDPAPQTAKTMWVACSPGAGARAARPGARERSAGPAAVAALPPAPHA